MTCRNRLDVLLVAVLTLVVPAACETDLSAALDQVRAAVPEICKDRCEDRLTCQWRSTSEGLAAEAFSSAVRRCIIDCAFVMDEGAFVTEMDPWSEKPTYVSHVGGSAVEKALGCLFEIGAYGCIEGGENSPDTHRLNPISESQCQAAADCLALLGADATLTWVPGGDGGACVSGGSQGLTIDFFE